MTIRLAWIDLETTGLEADKDVPLELGIVLTDQFGNKEPGLEQKWLVWEEEDKHFAAGVQRGMSNDFVHAMHEKSGLWNDLRRGVTFTRDQVDRQVCMFLAEHGVANATLPMAGNSIGSLDRPFVQRHFPKLNIALHYRNFDISTFKEGCRLLNPGLFENLKPFVEDKAAATHRVLDDCYASIREYQLYQEEFLIVGDDE